MTDLVEVPDYVHYEFLRSYPYTVMMEYVGNSEYVYVDADTQDVIAVRMPGKYLIKNLYDDAA